MQHTGVREPKNLQQEDGSSYYGSDSAYAVSGYRYAGGYIGKAAMGSTAAIGGASVLDHVLSATNLLSALTVVASIIDSSDVPVDMQENFLEFRFRIVILIILHIS